MKTSPFRFILLAAIAAGGAQAQAGEPAQTDDTKKAEAVAEPFAFADFSWAPGNYAPPTSMLQNKYFTPELRVDTAYHYSFANPADDTISGSSEVFRHAEFQLTQVGIGGDFNYENVGIRLMTQFGEYSETTARNDASTSRGQWDLADAYRYISEAYASYHLNVLNGINIQSGIFMSYIGLWSYYNFDNWSYQPSYVSSNTPWFFNGARVQIFTSDKFKIEPWLINGWQSYGRFNHTPGLGLQLLYKPAGYITWVGNQYFVGADAPGDPRRKRYHTDDSVMVKYHDAPTSTISKAAASLTLDAGCEDGGQVACAQQYFLGFMAYNRLWFEHDHYGVTIGGGAIKNPGRYLVLMPPINGATAASGTANDPATGNPYFSENPGDQFWAWDGSVTGDYMPTRNVTFRLEYVHRWASVPYFSGPGGVTPPGSTPNTYQNQGAPGSAVNGWAPDLVRTEDRVTAAMMVRL